MSKKWKLGQTLAGFMPLAPCVALALLLSCIDNNQHGGVEGPVIKTAYEYFVDLSKIPRCTYNEKAASDYVAAFGREFGLEAFQDSAFNVLIKKRGSKGREKEPPIILQAHIDMVCVKDDDEVHDFERDPIVPVITDDGWITAQKMTTLGADNGSGVSMIMAVLAANNISHPPIEALFTTKEEAGLIGAGEFDVGLLKGKRLINLDMTAEKTFIAGSPWEGGPVVMPIVTALMKAAAIPEWVYNPDSPLRDRMAEVFRDYYGEEPLVAGLKGAAVECAVFASKIPDSDMVSIGPDILYIHTSNERIDLASYNRVYEYLVKVLERL